MDVEVEGGQAEEDDEEFGPDMSRDRWTERADVEEEEDMTGEEELFEVYARIMVGRQSRRKRPDRGRA